MLDRRKHIHFVGIGGAGMSGLAELLAASGHKVSGSDLARSPVTERLAGLGIGVRHGHAPEHVGGADVVVVSSAVPAANPEVQEAHRRQVPILRRAEMLGELMRLKQGIAVAGAHGKTSTSAMIALVLERAGFDPTAVIGGRVQALGGSARLGRGAHLVAEADESDRSFLALSPAMAVITNVDREHLEAYGGFEPLLDAFVAFANRVPSGGTVLVGHDDAALRELRKRIVPRVVTFGLEPGADLRGEEVELRPYGARCRVGHRDGPLGALELQVPGRHSLRNALASVAVALELGIPFDRAAGALAGFAGAERRFQRLGAAAGVTVVDDYGHHPTEIAAVLEAAQATGARRVIVVFQPHRYTRTRDLLDEFGRVLAGADALVLTDIYPAGEDALPGVTADAVARAVRAHGGPPPEVVSALDRIAPAVARLARAGDLVVTLGAGSIGKVGPLLLDVLARKGTS